MRVLLRARVCQSCRELDRRGGGKKGEGRQSTRLRFPTNIMNGGRHPPPDLMEIILDKEGVESYPTRSEWFEARTIEREGERGTGHQLSTQVSGARVGFLAVPSYMLPMSRLSTCPRWEIGRKISACPPFKVLLGAVYRGLPVLFFFPFSFMHTPFSTPTSNRSSR